MRWRWNERWVCVLWERDGRNSSSSSRVVLDSPVELRTSSSSGRRCVFSSKSKAMSGIDGRLGGRLLGAILGFSLGLRWSPGKSRRVPGGVEHGMLFATLSTIWNGELGDDGASRRRQGWRTSPGLTACQTHHYYNFLVPQPSSHFLRHGSRSAAALGTLVVVRHVGGRRRSWGGTAISGWFRLTLPDVRHWANVH